MSVMSQRLFIRSSLQKPELDTLRLAITTEYYYPFYPLPSN